MTYRRPPLKPGFFAEDALSVLLKSIAAVTYGCGSTWRCAIPLYITREHHSCDHA